MQAKNELPASWQVPTRRFAPPILAGALALAVALLSMTPVAAEGDDSLVEDTDLPYMVLPVADLGDEFSDFRIEAFGGFDPEEDRDPGEINAYTSLYSPAYFGAPFDLSFPGTGVALFTNADVASSWIPGALDELRQDIEPEGGTFETFAVLDLAEEAFGVTISSEADDFQFRETLVLFRTGRLIGAALIYRDDFGDTEDQTVAIARTLLERMQGVVKGDVTDLPGVLPPDVNCNGVLNAIDATLLLQLSAALISALRCDFLADANGDGRVDAVDATLILQFDAGLIFQFVSN
jgi:hypothetical protein